MSGPNRGRYTVQLGGLWRLYTHPLPDWSMLGTIQRGMDIGALGESLAHDLAQINAGAVRAVDQRKARAALDAARREKKLTRTPVRICIPNGLEFSALKLKRDSSTGGDMEFDWSPIEAICAASGVDVSVFRDQDEGNIAGLLTTWYAEHRAAGGRPDRVMDDLIAETDIEDTHGGGYSHQPGRA